MTPQDSLRAHHAKTQRWLDSLVVGETYALTARRRDTGVIRPIYAVYVRPIYGYITSREGTNFAELPAAQHHAGHLRGLFEYLPDHPGNIGYWSGRFLVGVPPLVLFQTFAVTEEDLYERAAARQVAAAKAAQADPLRDLADAWWLFDVGYLSGPEMDQLVQKITGRPKLGAKQGAMTLLSRYEVPPSPGRCPHPNCDCFLEDAACPIHSNVVELED